MTNPSMNTDAAPKSRRCDGWWLRGQANFDTAIARATMGEALSRISRCLVKDITATLNAHEDH